MPTTPPPYELIADDLREGDAIPFFGAAASAVYRPTNEAWHPGQGFMPFGYELATTLAGVAQYPVTENQTPSLAVVASYAEYVKGHRYGVERKLHEYFSVSCEPGLLHQVLASVENTKIYVTTNYDTLLEKALSAREPHLIVDRGKKGLWVTRAGEVPQPVGPNDLRSLLTDPATREPSRPIVFKLHGSVTKDIKNDAYLITEEDYVDFLGRRGNSYLPPYVSSLMTKSRSFLFLGYSLADWNVRVILHKILSRSREGIRIWAIVNGQSDVEQELWSARDLSVYSLDLREFATELAKHL